MFLISVFICFCLASAFNYFNTRKKRTLITNIKGPLTLPLSGSAHKIFLLSPKNFFKKSQQYTEQFGSLSRCWVFHRLFILTNDYEFVEQLLQDAAFQNTGYELLKPWLGSGLLMNDGEKWQHKRQLMSHSMQGDVLSEYIEVFAEQANILNERMSVESETACSFDVHSYLLKAVLDVIMETTLGVKGHVQYDISTEYAKTVMDLTTLFTERFLSVAAMNNATFTVMTPCQKRRHTKLIKFIKRLNNDIIEQQRASKDNKEKVNNNIFTIQLNGAYEPIRPINKKCTTLLDILLEAQIDGVPLTNVEICDELNTFVFQGHLLTSAALAFALVMIARHPTVQRKVFEEVQSVCQLDDEFKFSRQHLDKLPYLECVIKETLRLYPVLPIIGRQLKENFNYTHSQVGDGIMPAGAEIYICLFDMLRNPEKFTKPTTFMPERFLQSECSSNLLSFSMGPRNCLAQKYVLLLMKTFIVKILRAYELLPYGDELKLEVKIVLKSLSGFQIGLKQRTL